MTLRADKYALTFSRKEREIKTPLTTKCVWFTGDHKVCGTVCGVLLHVQETRQDRPQRDAHVWRDRAS